ncbi:pyridoxamine 5-phosphate oxidase [Frigidibacter sp. RF13]|uniref:HugZ family pyridoxamine 5'-phosphate oxidase n=1 Tax=Frigidibacter sp. RF13 TaxID=2997340 RepID=UPI00226DE537|nr:pyridoxamine 5'-phosphate oxidase family protein [Frigidibacter sp. RF13]MCY1126820.1 pyridoxamine 5-phosphate oxidase [Frigidibacter sp. RF13]
MSTRADPVLPADDAARALARSLWQGAKTAALAFTDPATGAPMIARVGFGLAADGTGLTLVSDLAQHTRALRAEPRAALLLGEPGPKGDPLNSPRLSVAVTARFAVPEDRATLRASWLARHPKAKLYVDFADFHFVRFDVTEAFLNGGFGRAYRIAAEDLHG